MKKVAMFDSGLNDLGILKVWGEGEGGSEEGGVNGSEFQRQQGEGGMSVFWFSDYKGV